MLAIVIHGGAGNISDEDRVVFMSGPAALAGRARVANTDADGREYA